MKWVDTWPPPKLKKMQNDSTTGLARLTGYVHSLLIVSSSKTINRSLNTGMKYHWTNGKTRPFRSVQFSLITRDPFTHPPSNRTLHCLWVIDALSCFLMVYLVTSTGTQATISVFEKWIHSFGIPQSIVHD